MVFLSSRISPFASTVIFLREIAVGDRRRDGGDIPNLGREIARQPIHAVGEFLPHAGHAANIGLRAQFALRFPTSRATRITSAEKDRSWSTVALIAFFELEDFSASLDGDLLRQIAFGDGG
jgi:hypothetical protein